MLLFLIKQKNSSRALVGVNNCFLRLFGAFSLTGQVEKSTQNHSKFVQYHFEFVQSSFKVRSKFIQSSFKVHSKFVQSSFKIHQKKHSKLNFASMTRSKTTLPNAISKLRYRIHQKDKGVIELTETKVSEFPAKDSYLNELSGSQKNLKNGQTGKVKGKYGKYGGQYVPEVLMPALEELEEGYERYKNDPEFLAELDHYLRDFAGRETPLYFARNLSKKYGSKIYLKREDLVHGGAHKLNNAIGQALLAKYMGKTRLIAETGAGQHGTATAMAGANLGFETVVYMGAKDVKRQQMNAYRMELMGTEVVPWKPAQKPLRMLLMRLSGTGSRT